MSLAVDAAGPLRRDGWHCYHPDRVHRGGNRRVAAPRAGTPGHRASGTSFRHGQDDPCDACDVRRSEAATQKLTCVVSIRGARCPAQLRRDTHGRAALGFAEEVNAAAGSALVSPVHCCRGWRLPPPAARLRLGKPSDFDFLSGSWKIRNRQLKDGAWDEFEGEATVHGLLAGVASVEELRIPARNFSGMGSPARRRAPIVGGFLGQQQEWCTGPAARMGQFRRRGRALGQR